MKVNIYQIGRSLLFNLQIIFFRNMNLVGLFINNSLNGKGIVNGNDGRYSFIGEFKDGEKNGFGKETTFEYIYEGFFLNNKKNGKGKLLFKTTFDFYEGNFIDNNMTGEGFYSWANKDTYKGSFINGKMHGQGIYTWQSGRTYEGSYINGIKEGWGILRHNNKILYEGEFKDGVPDGTGYVYKKSIKTKITMKRGKISCEKINNETTTNLSTLDIGLGDIGKIQYIFYLLIKSGLSTIKNTEKSNILSTKTKK